MLRGMTAISATADPRQLLADAKTIAVVGFSTNPEKAAHYAPMKLVDAGWNVVPIHPTATEINGLTAYKSLGDVPGQVDLVDVFRPAAEAPGIAREAAAIGAKTLWLQAGITSPDAARIAAEAGMDFVENLCAGATAAQYQVTPGNPGPTMPR